MRYFGKIRVVKPGRTVEFGENMNDLDNRAGIY